MANMILSTPALPISMVAEPAPSGKRTDLRTPGQSNWLEKALDFTNLPFSATSTQAQVLAGGKRAHLQGQLANGYYIEPTIFAGHNKMRVFQEEIFGPVVSVAKFKDDAEAPSIASDTLYGLGAGVWTRNGARTYRFGREIQAGRLWTNGYHAYPAHAAFGGYKQSDIGRETHKTMLDHFQQTKNLLVSYSPKTLGFF